MAKTAHITQSIATIAEDVCPEVWRMEDDDRDGCHGRQDHRFVKKSLYLGHGESLLFRVGHFRYKVIPIHFTSPITTASRGHGTGSQAG